MIIKEYRFNGDKPAIAYTDYTAIYLSNNLVGDELEVARKHELAHIWLQHKIRAQQILLKDKKINNYLWNIAADLEIAKYIYDQNDVNIIKQPRGILNHGVLPEHCLDFPNCEYAEDFYNELLKNPDDVILISIDANGNVEIEVSDSLKEKVDVKSVVKQAKQIYEQHKKNNIIQSTQADLKYFKPPKPSLSSEIDKHLGRYKIDRVASYRRPNRRESDFIKKGFICVPKTPKMTIYVDRSGSFNEAKTSKATSRLKEVLLKYRGRISHDVIYFNNTLMHVDPIDGGGGTNYQCVLDDIMKTRAALSIIITDDDSVNISVVPKDLPNILVVRVGCNYTQLANTLRVMEVD